MKNSARIIALTALAATALGTVVLAQNAPPPAAPPHPMGFFITSTTPTGSGNLGGLSGADKICQDLAAGAGAGNRAWHAYLSTQPGPAGPGEDARNRIGRGPWYNAKNVLIAANVEDLHGDNARDRNNIQKSAALTENDREGRSHQRRRRHPQ
jgi:hypothetical protein